MRKYNAAIVVLLVACLAAQPLLAGSASAARLIPTEKGSLIIDGKETSSFQSEMPLPEGKLITCKGSCLVQGRNMQLVAHDKAVFALSEAPEQYDLTVQSGRIGFAAGPESKEIAFHTPDQTIRSEKTAVQGTDKVVRGFVSVTDKGAEIAVEEGALQVATANGTKLIEPGRPLTFGAGTAGMAAATAGLAGASSSGVSAGAVAAGGAVAGVGVAAGVAASANNVGGTTNSVSPSGLDTRPY
jgi:hypothetical protein